MKLIVTKRKNKKIVDFEKKEWVQVDLEHYGKNWDWTKKIFRIAAVEDQILGSLRMEIEAGVAYLNTLIVSSSQGKRGIGKTLLKKAERIAIENGAHKMYLVTGKTWDAVGFYEKLGYEKTGYLPNHYNHKDFIEMTKFL